MPGLTMPAVPQGSRGDKHEDLVQAVLRRLEERIPGVVERLAKLPATSAIPVQYARSSAPAADDEDSEADMDAAFDIIRQQRVSYAQARQMVRYARGESQPKDWMMLVGGPGQDEEAEQRANAERLATLTGLTPVECAIKLYGEDIAPRMYSNGGRGTRPMTDADAMRAIDYVQQHGCSWDEALLRLGLRRSNT